MRLNRLINAHGEVIGYFSDFAVEMTARKEWNAHHIEVDEWPPGTSPCRSIVTSVTLTDLEDVGVGDGERIDYIYINKCGFDRAGLPSSAADRVVDWSRHGAAAVTVSRHLVNKYRRPGGSLRDADLGGPAQAAGVLYVLRVRASQ